jgi:hypothetical protein
MGAKPSMTPLLLSRTLELPDYERFAEELKVVDRHNGQDLGLHRRWEFALALHAIWRWREARERQPEGTIYAIGDIGRLDLMLTEWTECEVAVMRTPLHGWVQSETALTDVVTCVSVITHVPDVEQLVYQLSCLLAPGGLLVLTMEFWNRCGPDQAHHHHQRQRIYCPKTYAALRTLAQSYHLSTFGGLDPAYHGAQVMDYTLASLVLEKKRC